MKLEDKREQEGGCGIKLKQVGNMRMTDFCNKWREDKGNLGR